MSPPTWQQMPRSTGTSMICCSLRMSSCVARRPEARQPDAAPNARAVRLRAEDRRVALVHPGVTGSSTGVFERRRVVDVDPVVLARSSGRARCSAGPPRRACRRRTSPRPFSARSRGSCSQTLAGALRVQHAAVGQHGEVDRLTRRSSSVTFWDWESGGGPDWAAASEGHARHTPSDAIKPAAHLTPWFIIALPSSVMESR